MLKTYYCSEVQNRFSFCEAEEIRAADVFGAMREANKLQMFQGTVLVLGDEINEKGFILPENVLSIKESGRWKYVRNEDYMPESDD